MRNKKLVLALGLLLTLPSLPGMAAKKEAVSKEDASPVWDRLVPAWDRLSDKLIDFAGADKQKLLADLAFAAVGAEVCDNLSLDRDKFKGEFDSLNDARYKALPKAEQELYGPKLMSFYGAYVGLITAESLLEKTDFCGYAQDQLGRPSGRFWVQTSANAQ